MEIEETLLRLVDFILFEKEWEENIDGLHLARFFDAIAEFAELYDINLRK
jgi:hypothetical protein